MFNTTALIFVGYDAEGLAVYRTVTKKQGN